MLLDLTWLAGSFDPDQICGPQDRQRIVKGFVGTEVISDHWNVPQVWFPIVEDTPRRHENVPRPSCLVCVQQLVREVIWVTHPKVECLKASLTFKNCDYLCTPLAGVRRTPRRDDARENSHGTLTIFRTCRRFQLTCLPRAAGCIAMPLYVN